VTISRSQSSDHGSKFILEILLPAFDHVVIHANRYHFGCPLLFGAVAPSRQSAGQVTTRINCPWHRGNFARKIRILTNREPFASQRQNSLLCILPTTRAKHFANRQTAEPGCRRPKMLMAAIHDKCLLLNGSSAGFFTRPH
jgi:hypothetical protein